MSCRAACVVVVISFADDVTDTWRDHVTRKSTSTGNDVIYRVTDSADNAAAACGDGFMLGRRLAVCVPQSEEYSLRLLVSTTTSWAPAL